MESTETTTWQVCGASNQASLSLGDASSLLLLASNITTYIDDHSWDLLAVMLYHFW